MSRDVGQLGENFFSVWCSQAEITANKSIIDKWGWDFKLEFPEENNINKPIDEIPIPIKCTVQVKSTDGKRGKEQIEVSTLKNLVKTIEPVFFCFIEFFGEQNPRNVYLVHLGEDIIGQVLKRVRELESKGKKDLNKHKVTITYKNDINKLSSLDGQGLKVKIKSFILDGMESYVFEKQKILNEIGFSSGRREITVSFPKSELEKLCNSSIGINTNTEIDVLSFNSYSTRFGIKLEDIDASKISSKMTVMPASNTIGRLIIKEHLLDPGMSFESKIFFSIGFQNKSIPDKYKKVRITSKFIDIVLDFSTNDKLGIDIKFSFNKKQLWKMRDFSIFARLLNIVTSENFSTLFFFFNPSSEYYDVFANKKEIPMFALNKDCAIDFNLNEFRDYYWDKIAHSLNMLGEIAKEYKKYHEDIEISFTELDKAHRAIYLLHTFLDQGVNNTIPIEVLIDADLIPEGCNKITCIVLLKINLDKHYFGQFAILSGEIQQDKDGDTLRMSLNEKYLKEKIYFNPQDVYEDISEKINKYYDDIEAEIRSLDLGCILSNLQVF